MKCSTPQVDPTSELWRSVWSLACPARSSLLKVSHPASTVAHGSHRMKGTRLIYRVEVQSDNGQAKVFDDNGQIVCQFNPISGSFSSGQVDEANREVHMQHDNGDVGIYDLDTGTPKGWK